jgi:DNA (cytosine-5)-methyltransferase 1
MLNTLDLFAGIGGFSLGLERTGGFRTVAFCEIDKKAQKVLNKHWPDVPVFEDVSALTKEKLDEQGISVDVITGGFPCQDISTAGRGAGLSGSRSGLWFQFHRLIKEIQPRYALIENVSALRSRGLEQVLWSLAEIGYDAEWHCIPASAIGAPHQRDRIWIIAYMADTSSRRCGSQRERKMEQSRRTETERASFDLAYPHSAHSEGRRLSSRAYAQHADAVSAGWWETEPEVGRVANGLPGQSHRLKQLGNAVVPKIPQLLGEAILDWERQA